MDFEIILRYKLYQLIYWFLSFFKFKLIEESEILTPELKNKYDDL
jgi:hypothetical protein